MFHLSIELGNEAMENAEHVADALETVVKALRAGRTDGRIRDENGNSVGEYRLEE